MNSKDTGMGKPTNKKFTLKLMSDMFAIPEERFDEFLVDLRKWHKIGKSFDGVVQSISKAVGEKMPDDYMTMHWLDDGIHEGKTKIIINPPKPVTQKDKSEGSN